MYALSETKVKEQFKKFVSRCVARPIRLPGRMFCVQITKHTDAVLSQVDASGKEHPIGFASRALATAERNYCQFEKDALAVVYGVPLTQLPVWSEIHIDYGSSAVTRSIWNSMSDTRYGVRANDSLVFNAAGLH